ncbi:MULTISPECIES: VOC family protein [Metabacillus]|uniref:Bleomycin resistance protein n=2 Tax=Metabacillus TaxID=2675233 RepID=A0A179SMX3_9BACI|nr:MULTISPECIES: VOC family protein [Metabacillus]OAS82724.1 bleomycin resistance protein [Metabacillus litoralis]QNF30163.1 VOC family protein [Metabacillus sp. KUDC1714]
MNKIDNNNLIKVGLIVDDINAAAKNFSELFGIEMPEIILPPEDYTPDPTRETYTVFRGEQVPARVKIANLQMGPVTVELLEPFNEVSPYTEFKEKHGQGVQFITFTVNGFEEHINFVEEKGIPLVHKGEYGVGRYCFFDSVPQLGVMLGLQELGHKS